MRYTRWDQKGTSELTNEVLFRLSLWHLEEATSSEEFAFDTLCEESESPEFNTISSSFTPSRPLREITALVKERNFSGLCHYSLSANHLSVDSYKHLRQVLAFFSKRKDLSIGIDTAAVAWSKAVEAETLCRESNDIFRKYFRGGFQFRPCVESVLFRTQRKISSILGDLPGLSDIKLRFGPGATTQVKKKDASVRRKLAQTFASSEDAIRLLPELLAEVPLWSGTSVRDDKKDFVSVSLHRGRVDFVRKTAKTDRTISVEPALNTLVQLGIGDYIADRLRCEGVDIRDQTRNQRLAREGSLTGALATLDLSSASDTISCGLVESLLPYEWWDFLRSARTGESSSPDGEFRLEKFSSMGNGFTFALETLIFYSLAISCCDGSEHKSVMAYGDDIIVPVGRAPLLMEVLASCGFIVNYDKTFTSGKFRESCGKDYYSGTDVRPCYIKASLSAADIFVLHNFYVRAGYPSEPSNFLLEYLDASLKIWGPDGYGDGHLIGDFVAKSLHRELGWSGYTFETFTYKARKAFYRLGADHVFPSYSIYMKESPTESWHSDLPSRSMGIRSLRGRIKSQIHGASRPEVSASEYGFKNGREYLVDTDRKSVV